MGLKLIIGAAASGKSELVNRGLVAAARQLQPVLVVPSGPDVRRAEREFALTGNMGVRPVTLDKWVEELWGLHGDGRRIVGAAARAAMIAAVVETNELGELETSGRTPGFVDLLSDIAKRVTVRTQRGGGVLGGVSDLLCAYQDRLREAGMIEPAEATAVLAQKNLGGLGPIGVNRFADLTPSQEGLLVALAKDNDVAIALSWVDGMVATAALTPLVERIIAAGAECITAEVADSGEKGLAVLADSIFQGGDVQPVPRSLLLAEAAGEEAEAALAARFARSAMEEGARPEEVAIAFRDVAARRTVLAAALDACGVPAVFDVSLSFGKAPLGAALLALLDACAGRGDVRERVLAYLNTPYSGSEASTVSTLDATWRTKRFDDRSIVRSLAGIPGGGKAAAIALELVGSRIEGGTARKWEELATLLLVNAARSRKAVGVESAVDSAVHRGLLRAVSEVASAGGGATEADLNRALRSVRISTSDSEQQGCVLVTEAHRLQGRRFDTLILGGLTAAEFSPTARESLAAGICARLGAMPGADPVQRERMLFHTLITRAKRELVLIRQTSDERGEAIRPSEFWDEVLDVYRAPQQADDDIFPEGLRVERLSISELAEAAPLFLPGRQEARARARECAPVPPRRGILQSDEAIEALALDDEVGISEVETYLSCPYRWFYQRVIRPRDIDAEFDARERGSLAHGVLATFYGQWAARGSGRIAPHELDEALQLLDLAAGAVRAAAGRTRAVTLAEEVSVAKAVAWARGILTDDVSFLPGFIPEHHELRFGRAYDRPIEIDGVALKGSIDRVDVSARGLVVVDYKSSSTVEGRGAFESKGLLQIPVYTSVASQILDIPPLGGLYRSMKTMSARGFWHTDEIDLAGRGSDKDAVDTEGLRLEMKRAAELLSATVGDMRAGLIGPKPLSSRACDHCDASDVCGGSI